MAILKRILLIFVLVLALFSFDKAFCAPSVCLSDFVSISAKYDLNNTISRRKAPLASLSNLASSRCSFSSYNTQSSGFGTLSACSFLDRISKESIYALKNKFIENTFEKPELLAHVLFLNAP